MLTRTEPNSLIYNYRCLIISAQHTTIDFNSDVPTYATGHGITELFINLLTTIFIVLIFLHYLIC